MTTPPSAWPLDWKRTQLGALVVGLLAIVVCAIAALFDPAQFYRAYLIAYLFCLGVPLGSAAILMVYHLTGGAWGFLIRRILEAAMRTLPLLVVLFVPIGFGLRFIYPWATASASSLGEHPTSKEIYFYAPFFWARQVVYFVLWLGIGYLLSTWSRRQDETGDPGILTRLGRFGAIGLILYGISITFASVDWVMSLELKFRSTIFGPLFASGEIVLAQALAIVVLCRLIAHPRMANLISLEVLNDLGNLLFTFLIVWAYLAFFQFMIIWIGNLPHEIIWYLRRSENGWQWVAWALFVFHFAIPFVLLLMRDIKRSPVRLAGVAGLIVFMQLVYLNFLVLPAFPSIGLADVWMNFLMPLGLGGVWSAYFLRELGRWPLFPRHDPNEESALHLQILDHEGQAREEGPHV
jgi:hypothetical protein